MSDSEIDLSEESSEDADFSASEEEYIPTKNSNESSEDEDDDDDSDFDDSKKPVASTSFVPPNRFKKLKPSLKSNNSPVKLSKKLSNILEKSKFQKKKNLSTGNSVEETISESDSDSGDDNLVDPNKLDLNSDFFNIPTKLNTPPPPDFDCNAGINSSDESEDDFADVPTDDDKNKSVGDVNFVKLQEFSKNLEVAKEHLKNYKAKVVEEAGAVDVSQLLALGETEITKTSTKNATKSKARKRKDSNSDWEEVQESHEKSKTTASNLQITVQLPTTLRIKSKKEVDLDACMKRKFNKIRKDHQVCLHKTNLLCWIAHGNLLNQILNDPLLMAQCLSLMPSAMSYPTEKTNVTYFKQISTWYKGLITVKDQSQYPVIKKRPPLATSLGLQIKSKTAICKRDYILIFIILLRALGIQCRLVMNLVNNPLRPNQSDLCSLSTKTAKKTSDSKDKKEKASPTNTNGSTPKKKEIKSSQSHASKSKEETKTAPTKKTESTSKKKEIKSSEANTSKSKEEVKKSQPLKSIAKKIQSSEVSAPSPRRLRNKTVIPQLDGNDDLKETKKPIASKTTVFKQRSVQLHNLRSKPSTSKETVVLKKPIESKSIKVAPKRRSHSLVDDNLKPTTSKETLKPSPKKRIKSSTDVNPTKITKPKAAQKRRSVSLSDDDFQPSRSKKSAVNAKIAAVKRIDKRVLSTDDDERDTNVVVSNKKKSDYWIEVFCEEDEKWVTIDAIKGKVDCVDDIRKSATTPIAYVIAWNNDNSIKDISPRYCPQWNTTTRLLRVGKDWFDSAFNQFMGKKTRRDIKEDKELNKMHLNAPLPTSIKEFKDHPLYALERDLLKFQAIYPPNALTLGFIRKEPVYARECVYTLHSREIWLKSAKTVKMGEVPYKIVKARPKWDRHTNTCSKEDIPLEIFGFWQTEDFVPPTAENGIVPRNAYGNVELFKACMLPKKTVHLQFAGLARVCKKLRVDCAPAVVGFDYHSGGCHPTYDGFVICEEFQEKVTEAWLLDQEESERRENEKYEKRVYDNWKKLIKGLLIRRKLQRKYNFNLDGKNGEGEDEEEIADEEAVSKKKRGKK